MTRDKAIEILTDLQHPSGFTLSPDIKDAVGLGTEALKWYKEHCSHFAPGQFKLLPGETEGD